MTSSIRSAVPASTARSWSPVRRRARQIFRLQAEMHADMFDWRLRAEDLRALPRVHELVEKEVKRLGLGETYVVTDADRYGLGRFNGGHHHMGTTRMHIHPVQGVVDANCRVHSLSNLYVSGSSVFPTAGFANPTLTVVALAIRLADHLKKRMRSHD